MTGKMDREAVDLTTATMLEADIILFPEAGIRLILTANRKGLSHTG